MQNILIFRAMFEVKLLGKRNRKRKFVSKKVWRV